MSWKETFVFAAAAVCLATPIRAQGTIQSVRFYRVKPDRVADFNAATKQFAETVKKAGSERYYSVWHSLSGNNEYVRVDLYNKYADLDQGPDPKTKEQATTLSGLAVHIGECTESNRRTLSEVLPELSIPLTGELPKMIRVIQTEVKSDKINEYVALIKSEVVPAQKKLGQKFYSVSRISYGGTGFTSVAGIDKWADLDGGTAIQKASGPEAYQRFLTKLAGLMVHQEINVYALVPDSSYMRQMK